MKLMFKNARALLEKYRGVRAIKKRNKMLKDLNKTDLAYILKEGKNEATTEDIK